RLSGIAGESTGITDGTHGASYCECWFCGQLRVVNKSFELDGNIRVRNCLDGDSCSTKAGTTTDFAASNAASSGTWLNAERHCACIEQCRFNAVSCQLYWRTKMSAPEPKWLADFIREVEPQHKKQVADNTLNYARMRFKKVMDRIFANEVGK